jgi:membrane-bound ClpP family serine protease
MRFKILGRDPAAILYGVQSLLAIGVAFHVLGLTSQSADWVMLIANGLMSLVVALTTRPFVVAAIIGAVQTIMTGIVAFGLPNLTFTTEQQGVSLAALAAILALLLRQNQNPKETVVSNA